MSQGFLPRAFELLKLGVVSSAYFIPIALVVVGIIAAVYAVAGTDFIHSGTEQRENGLYDPEVLLEEPPVDKTVPLR